MGNPGNKTLGLLVPDGVGVRNFVVGQFLRQASSLGRAHVLHTVPDDLLPLYASPLNGNVDWHTLLPYAERPVSFILRNCLSCAHMHWVGTYPMRRTFNRPLSGSWRTTSAIRLARLTGRMLASPHGIQFLDRAHAWAVSRFPEVEHYRRLFRQIKPAVLFCSHQRPTVILPPVLAARSLGIPTATFIFSWDNLSTKARIAAPFDHFLVWSPNMRDELLRYYPDVSESRVHVVGTPQFDPYADPDLHWSREEYFRRIGADPARPLICYSGGDRTMAPEDPLHVALLLEQIRSGKIRRRPQILLRPSPIDDGSRFERVRRDYPELLYGKPEWIHAQPDAWTKFFPAPIDVQNLVNATYHADLNVNFGSTMTLDFAIRNKPVVNLAFDLSDTPHHGMPMWDFLLKFRHYRPVIELGAARMARSPDELAEHVNAYLADPTLDSEGRRRFVELEIGVPIGGSCRRVLEVLDELAS